MFTGIVQSKAQVLLAKVEKGICKLIIEVANEVANNIELGASIAINGVCLTVVSFKENTDKTTAINFDVIDETLRVTNLNHLKTGGYVNFERSLKVGDEIGGHQVSGHIHGLASIAEITNNEDNCEIKFKLASGDSKYLFEKGFVAINGISLTLGKVSESVFSVHLIPETLARTNIGDLDVGGKVNIEFDQQTITIVNTIERMNLKVV